MLNCLIPWINACVDKEQDINGNTVATTKH